MRDRSEQARVRALRRTRAVVPEPDPSWPEPIQAKVRHKHGAWVRRIWRRYGITVEQVVQIWVVRQGGTCPVCRQQLDGKRWVIDHNHKTGRVRGILCSYCNRYMIGAMERCGRLRVRWGARYLNKEGWKRP